MPLVAPPLRRSADRPNACRASWKKDSRAGTLSGSHSSQRKSSAEAVTLECSSTTSLVPDSAMP